MEDRIDNPQKIKKRIPCDPPIPLQVFIQKNRNHDCEERIEFQSSLWHYSQKPRCGNDLNIHWWMNG